MTTSAEGTLLDRYTLIVVRVPEEDGGGYKAMFHELALSVTGYGATREEAEADLLLATGVATDHLRAAGRPLPEPASFALAS